jgi:outer membrane protein assembly factor BamB
LAASFVPAQAADWPQFLGPTSNGVSTETDLLPTWGAKGPPRLWEKEVGEGFSGPVVAGDTVVLLHRVGNEEVVEALDAATGKGRWRFAYPARYRDAFGKGDGPRATPAVAAGRVYTLGAEGRLHCLDLATGKKVWERSLATEYRPPPSFFGVGTSPLVEGDLVLVNVGARQAGVVAFQKDTGQQVWVATDHEASYASPVAATIDGVRHVFFFTREGLVSVDPANGRVRFSKRWRSRMQASVNAASPLVVGDQIFLSASYGTGAVLLRVRKDAVDEVWSGDDVLSCHYVTSIHHAGFLYGFDGRQESGTQLRCVEWKTGKLRWTRPGFRCGPMILAEGNLIVLSEDGELCLIEATPEAYREKARALVLGKPCRAPMALAEGRLFARDNQRLVCWNLKASGSSETRPRR